MMQNTLSITERSSGTDFNEKSKWRKSDIMCLYDF